KNPKMEGRDRFVLSKGHAAPVLYSALAERGYFDRALLDTLRAYGSPLQGHPDMRKVPGVEISTGSLGQGLSVANGMALSARISNEDYRTYILMGDGELQEGQVWEAAMTAAHYKLDSICAFIDCNNLQIDGNVDKIMGVEPLDKKWEAFGWNVIKIDGHDFNEIFQALDAAKKVKGMPTVIIANTVKGKGVSFMENVCGFHGVAPTAEETVRAVAELEKVSEI
ncbi:MAG: transketolase, partial [Cetobacterium sp.]